MKTIRGFPQCSHATIAKINTCHSGGLRNFVDLDFLLILLA